LERTKTTNQKAVRGGEHLENKPEATSSFLQKAFWDRPHRKKMGVKQYYEKKSRPLREREGVDDLTDGRKNK